MDSLAKARSRIWNKPQAVLREVPFFPLLIGTFFLVGLSPFASGTVGSAVAAALYFLLPALQDNWILVGAIVLCLTAGIVASNKIITGAKEKDPGIIVIDEVVGQWIALLSLWYQGNVVFLVSAFILFRVFDVLKIYPATIFERRQSGAAVMLDDVVAGIYANIGAHLATFFIYRFFL